jgi:mRNA interferase HigB
MHVISQKKLREFWAKWPEAEAPLRAWHRLVEQATWESFADVREVYPHADRVGRCTVFNVGGNKYRLVVVIHWFLDALSALTRPASLAVSRATGFWGSPECAGKRVPDCSDRGGYSLIRQDSPTGNHGQGAPPRGVSHAGWFSSTSESYDLLWNAAVGYNIGVLSVAHSLEQLEQAPHTHIISSVATLPGLRNAD